jgi:hypothetical protein
MLDTNSSGRLLNSRNVTWKAKASQPLDPTRIYRWKSELTPSEKKMAEAMVGDRIQAHGYDIENTFRSIGELIPGDILANKYRNELEEFFQAGIRFWKKNKSERTTVKIFLGDPSSNKWIGENQLKGSIESLLLSINILLDKRRKKSIYWIIKKNEDQWSGFNSFILKKALSSNKNIF